MCKKYPESNLWFKNPKNIAFIDGKMTHYVVNGVDSIMYLNNFFYNDMNGNPYSHNFSDLKFWSERVQKGAYQFIVYKPEDYVFVGNVINESIEYEYINKGKNLKLYGTKSILKSYGKNIFVNDAIIWKITYLKRNDKKRIMKGEYNGNSYEIQFN